jgi:TonB family protein
MMHVLWNSAAKSAKTTPAKIVVTRVLATSVLLSVFGCVLAWCAVPEVSRVAGDRAALTRLEETLRRVPVHISEFSPMSEPMALPVCGDVRPPEALLTPDPLLHINDDAPLVRVSFIVGSDGHVHSAFILDSGGPAEDQIVLGAVRFWRYRPALCNGVPTDSEARVRFSLR